jgi:hypothetical protein
MKPVQVDLVTGAKSRASSAVVLDWHKPFAAKVMSHLYEYDDWPKPFNTNTVTPLPTPGKFRAGTLQAKLLHGPIPFCARTAVPRE